MGRIAVPSDFPSTVADLQTQIDEVARRTVPSATSLENLPRGLKARSARTSGNITSAGGVRRLIRDVSATLVGGRVYRVGASCAVWVDGSPSGIVDVYLNYTTDGSQPSASSAQLDHQPASPVPGGIPFPVQLGDFVAPAADLTLRVVLSFLGSDPARTYGCWGSSDMPARLWIVDEGIDPGLTGADY